MLSRGEFVVNADAAAQHASLLQAINSDGALHLAAGGPVGLRAGPAFGGGGISVRGGDVIVQRNADNIAERQAAISQGRVF
jgi:hypothetical protein